MFGDLLIAAIWLVACPLMVGLLIAPRFGLSIAWFTGLLATGMLGQLLHYLNTPTFVVQIVLVVLLTAVSGGLVIQCKRGAFRPTLMAPWSHYAALIVALSPLLAYSVVVILAQPIESWDAIAIWLNKAKHIAYGLPFQGSPIIAYPNLGPALWANVMLHSDMQEEFGRLVFPLIHIVSFTAIFEVLAMEHKSSINTSILTAIAAYAGFSSAVYNGYQDAFVRASLGIGLLLVFVCMRQAHDSGSIPRSSKLLLFLFLGCTRFIKNEAALFSSLIVAVFLALEWYRLKSLRILIRQYALPMNMYFFLIFLWPLMLFARNLNGLEVQGNAFTLRSAFQSLTHYERIPLIAKYLCVFTKNYIWVIGPGLTAMALGFWRLPSLRKYLTALACYAALHMLSIIFIFLATQQDIHWHLQTAFDRLMHQSFAWPPIVLIFVSGYLFCKPFLTNSTIAKSRSPLP